jgi:protein-disulfide isomerase
VFPSFVAPKPFLLWLPRRLAPLALALLTIACVATSGPVAPPPKPPDAIKAPLPKVAVLVGDQQYGGGPAIGQGVIPVTERDPSWGSATAPVTIVEFSDFECPFCGRALSTLQEIQRAYGPDRVRLVWKHNPLPFHKNAAPAHEAAAIVFALGGSVAFYRFHDLAFANRTGLNPDKFADWAEQSGVDRSAFRGAWNDKKLTGKVYEDIELAKQLQATGTPTFFVNGVKIVGAQPFDKFKPVIDAELAAASDLRKAGTPAEDVYAARTSVNFAAPAPPPPVAADAEDEKEGQAFQVPVFPDDPTRGPADALVTVVIFSEFQCPFCKRVGETLDEVVKTYGADVRLVWKDHPLPFHPRALPAATLGRAAFKRGNAVFWKVHDALFASQPDLEDEELSIIAKLNGIPWAPLERDIARRAWPAKIGASQDLAHDLEVRGTPHFFINGVRLAGAQPFLAFKDRIDKELERARALVASGVPRAKVYAAIMKEATPPPPPETKDVGPAPATSPSKGPANAKVVIQVFSEFQCPFCRRVLPALKELEQAFPGQLRFVWRHLPLPFHKQAKLAAEASEAVREQKGDAGFWAFHDKVFEAQEDPRGLSREHLLEIAASLGVDRARLEGALDAHTYLSRIEADEKAASEADINGTPGFVINGYFVGGAQSASVFKKVVRHALDEAKQPAKKP